MNSKFLIFLVFMLSAAIFAPSVISLLDLESTTVLVLDHNEEEESQEAPSDKDQQEFFDAKHFDKFLVVLKKGNFINSKPFYGAYLTSLDILLPPPRNTQIS